MSEPPERSWEEILSDKGWYQILDSLPDLVAVIDSDYRIVRANRAMAKKLGISRKKLIGSTCYSVVHGTAGPPDYCPSTDAIRTGQVCLKEALEERLGGHCLYRSTLMKDSRGQPAGFIEIIRDISAQKQSEEELRTSELRAKAISDSALDAIIMIDGKGKISYFNTAAEKMFGYQHDEVKGRKLHNVLVSPKARKQYYDKLPVFENTGKCMVIGKTLEREAIKKDGSSFPVEISISAFKFRGEWHSVGSVRDITARKAMEEKLRETSITDELTGLLNRRGFQTLAKKQYEIARRSGRSFSVLYLDLNDMKMINDRFGHKEGDRALVDTANVLRESLRSSDILARVGGDEFTALIIDPRSRNVEKIISSNIIKNLKALNEKKGRRYELSLSMGFSHFDPDTPLTIDGLLAEADKNMYKEKRQIRDEEPETETAPAKAKERRRDARLDAGDRFPAELTVLDKIMIKNISMTGICLKSARPLAANNVYRIKLNQGDEELSPAGKVVWSKASGKSGKQTLFESGLAFTTLTNTEKKSLDRFIKTLNG